MTSQRFHIDPEWHPDVGGVGNMDSGRVLESMSSMGVRYHNIPPYHDEPKLFHLICVFSDELETAGLGGASATSWDFDRALTKAFGEMVERLGSTPPTDIGERFAAFDELSEPALDPHEIPFIGRSRPGRGDRVRWVDGWRIGPAGAVPGLVPAQLTYLPYTAADSEPLWFSPTSNGLAAGVSATHATANGLLEILERDALLRFWRNPGRARQLPRAAVCRSGPVASLVETSLRYDMAPAFYLLDTEGGVASTVVCVLTDGSGIGPPTTLGIKTSMNPLAAALGSIEEAHQLRPWLRDLQTNGDEVPEVLRTIEERARWWLTDEAQATLSERVAQTRPADGVELQDHSPTFGELVASVTGGGHQIWAVGLAGSDTGLSVARVVVPGIMPVYFDEKRAVRALDDPGAVPPMRHPLL
ncbi:hypothetical protein EF908_02090 [Streptomyces sp. WAC04770]|nr:hypothetical protein EF908_02090 [Streptomyces sp. WAC04770]